MTLLLLLGCGTLPPPPSPASGCSACGTLRPPPSPASGGGCPKGGRGPGGIGTKGLQDRVSHPVGILPQLHVLEAEHPVPADLEGLVALGILRLRGLVIVTRAIQLHHDSPGNAEEVDDEAVELGLAAERAPVELAAPEDRPQPSLFRGAVSP